MGMNRYRLSARAYLLLRRLLARRGEIGERTSQMQDAALWEMASRRLGRLSLIHKARAGRFRRERDEARQCAREYRDLYETELGNPVSFHALPWEAGEP